MTIKQTKPLARIGLPILTATALGSCAATGVASHGGQGQSGSSSRIIRSVSGSDVRVDGYIRQNGADIGYAKEANAFGFLISEASGYNTTSVEEIGIYYPHLRAVRQIADPCRDDSRPAASIDRFVVFGSSDTRLWVQCRTLSEFGAGRTDRVNRARVFEFDVGDPNNIAQRSLDYQLPGESLLEGEITERGTLIRNSLVNYGASAKERVDTVSAFAGGFPAIGEADVFEVVPTKGNCSNAARAPSETCWLAVRVAAAGDGYDYVGRVVGWEEYGGPEGVNYFEAVEVTPSGQHRVLASMDSRRSVGSSFQRSSRNWVVEYAHYKDLCDETPAWEDTLCFAHRLWSPHSGKEVFIHRYSPSGRLSKYTIGQLAFDRDGRYAVAMLRHANGSGRRLAVFDLTNVASGAVISLDAAIEVRSLPGLTRSIGVTEDGLILAFARTRIIHVGVL